MLAGHERKRRLRDPERTRERSLQATFREVYRSGFPECWHRYNSRRHQRHQGSHFESKEALGYAIIEESIAGLTRDKWFHPLRKGGEPIDTLVGIVRGTSVRPQDVRGGCPLNTLAQEMSPVDEHFRKRLAKVFLAWQEGIATAGTVRRDLDPDETASFLIATYEGYTSLAEISWGS